MYDNATVVRASEANEVVANIAGPKYDLHVIQEMQSR
jgi:hypothetical protein